jgi:cytochrome c oxidase subunit 4
MAHTHEEINHHIKVYLMVFGALLALTAATVGAWKLHFLAAGPAIALALVIASVKASLVALFFMHLNAEKKAIYWILALTVLFFFVLLLLPVFSAQHAVSL